MVDEALCSCTGIDRQLSNTNATLPIGKDFLFSLPPGSYELYIFEPDIALRTSSEKLEDDKLRYLYITRMSRPGGRSSKHIAALLTL